MWFFCLFLWIRLEKAPTNDICHSLNTCDKHEIDAIYCVFIRIKQSTQSANETEKKAERKIDNNGAYIKQLIRRTLYISKCMNSIVMIMNNDEEYRHFR